MDQIDRLTALFEKFPGIGPRQAQRFVHFLLRSPSSMRRELADSIEKIGSSVFRCLSCMRYHAGDRGQCNICSDAKRSNDLLAIVAHDADISALERSETYRGHYFVLGGTVLLSSAKTPRLRSGELVEQVKARMERGLKEIILALPANPEGDVTASHVRDVLREFDGLTITELGRGLSTGSELEYADTDTLRSALESRR